MVKQSCLPLLKHLVIGCMLVPVLFACSSSDDRQAKYFDRATEYFEEGNFEKARIEVKNVLQINPKNADARILLAKLHQNEGEFREAFANFNAAVEDNPEHVEARLGLARLYYAAGENSLAKEHADKVLVLEPENKDAQVLLASLSVREGEWEQGLAVANKVLAAHPGDEGAIAVLTSIYADSNPEKALQVVNDGLTIKPENESIKNLKLSLLLQAEDAEGTEKLLKELTREHPNIARYHLQLARGYAFQQRLDEAEQVLTNALALNPENHLIENSYIEFLAQRRGLEQAEAKIKTYITKKPDQYRYKELLAQLYLANARAEDARALFESVVSKNPTSTDALQARNSLANMDLLNGNREAAEVMLDQVFAIEPTNTTALITRARISLADNRLDDMTADLRTALRNDSENIPALKLLALAQERGGTPELALDSYRRIISIDTQDVGALVEAGRLSMSNNQTDMAEKFLSRALQLQAKNVQAITLLTQIHIANKNYNQAQTLADRMIAIEANKSAGYVLKATAYRAMGDWDNARAHYKLALDRSPETFEPLGGYIDSFLIDKQYDQAIDFLRKHLEQHPDLVFAKDILATVYTKSGNNKAAISTYEDIIKANPNVEAGYQKLASVYMSEGDTAKAEATYKRGLKHNAAFSSLRIYLANLYQQQEKYKQSKEQYELVIAAQPENILVKNNLAILLLNHFPSEANNQRALQLTADFSKSKQPVLLDTLGWAYYHLGNLTQAISFLEASVTRGQGKPEYHYHLGMAYHKDGQLDKAKKQLTLAVNNEGEKYFGLAEASKTLELL